LEQTDIMDENKLIDEQLRWDTGAAIVGGIICGGTWGLITWSWYAGGALGIAAAVAVLLRPWSELGGDGDERG
jgi:hypothetical protein